MIFITVGSQLPFDRLILGIDQIASEFAIDAFAQIGTGAYEPRNISWDRMLKPARFNELVQQATLIVSHAGIGSVLSAQRWGKPILIFPRLSSHGEHRNDHQLATLRALKGRDGIYTAETMQEIARVIKQPMVAAPVSLREPAARANLKFSLARIIRGEAA
jgi:UDP-N-acetylglucosamine transferase subunit ALG13